MGFGGGMIIDANGIYGKFLILGVQTNKGNTHAAAIRMANSWAPQKARSFDMTVSHTDYHGRSSDEETGYARVKVIYYSTLKEGKYLINNS